MAEQNNIEKPISDISSAFSGLAKIVLAQGAAQIAQASAQIANMEVEVKKLQVADAEQEKKIKNMVDDHLKRLQQACDALTNQVNSVCSSLESKILNLSKSFDESNRDNKDKLLKVAEILKA